MKRSLACLMVLTLGVSGCSTVKDLLGLTGSDASIKIKATENRWLLIKNPRFGDVPSEPQYIWVEEEKIPFTIMGFLRPKSIIAPPEIVAQYGPPPGGGKISPKQRMLYQVAGAGTEPARSSTVAAAGTPSRPTTPAVELPKRGYVVWIDTTRIVIDLTSQDGLKPGSVVSLRRDKMPIIHPVTGEVLGELDEEVATATVVETRDKFSVAEIQTVTPGSEVHVRDRAVPK